MTVVLPVKLDPWPSWLTKGTICPRTFWKNTVRHFLAKAELLQKRRDAENK